MKRYILITSMLLININVIKAFAFEAEIRLYHPSDTILLLKQRTQILYEITGRVIDVNQQPMSYVSIILKSSLRTKLIRSIMTDSAGRFIIKIAEKGSYQLTASAMGMDSVSVNVTLEDQQEITIPDIVLIMKITTLSEVTITGKKDLIENKIDRTIVNVGALLSNEGSNAFEVLEKTPGVSVDINGSVSFKGKTGVLILIDGRPTYLAGNDLSNYLKSLPASLLDKIELMDNPPAEYDAAGSAGVINIKTKKSKRPGFFACLSASYGIAHYSQTSESLNFNYRKDKINVFGNASYNFNQGYRKINLDRQYFDFNNNLASAFEQTAFIQPKSNSTYAKLGVDYSLSPKITLGLILTGRSSTGRTSNPSINRIYVEKYILNSILVAEASGRSKFTNQGINLNFNHQFDSAGKVLSFDLDYLNYESGNAQFFLNNTFNVAGSLVEEQIITNDLPVSTHIYSVKTDYILPLRNEANFSAGLKSSYVRTDNKADYFDVNNGLSQVNYNLSNNFLYKENINAIYINFNKTLNRQLEIQTGLRLENTNADGHQLGNVAHADSTFTLNYNNLFPTAFLSYKLDENGTNRVIISYDRRIGRPNYQDLNPFIFVSDKYTYSAGNPYLKSQFANNYKLAYNYKGLLNAALHYSYTSDIQSEIVRQQGDIFINGTGNIGIATVVGASINISVSPAKWWSLNSYLQVARNHFEGQIRTLYLNQSTFYGTGNLTSQFILSKSWSVELSGYYYMRRTSGQQINNPVGQINAGVQKKLMDNKVSVRLSVRDVFNTYTSDGTINFIPNATSSFKNRFNSQAFTLSLSYNLGKALKESSKRSSGSAEDEKGRVRSY